MLAIIRCCVGSSDSLLHSVFAQRLHPVQLELGVSAHPMVHVVRASSTAHQILQHMHCYYSWGTIGSSDDVFSFLTRF
jgi:hypothetical protein